MFSDGLFENIYIYFTERRLSFEKEQIRLKTQ